MYLLTRPPEFCMAIPTIAYSQLMPEKSNVLADVEYLLLNKLSKEVRLDNLSNFYYDYLSGPSYQIHCRKINRVVSIDIDISGKTLKEVLSSIIIKEPFRPTFYKLAVPLVSWSSSNTYGMLELHSNGTFTSYLWENNSLVTWHLTLTFIN